MLVMSSVGAVLPAREKGKEMSRKSRLCGYMLNDVVVYALEYELGSEIDSSC